MGDAIQGCCKVALQNKKPIAGKARTVLRVVKSPLSCHVARYMLLASPTLQTSVWSLPHWSDHVFVGELPRHNLQVHRNLLRTLDVFA